MSDNLLKMATTAVRVAFSCWLLPLFALTQTSTAKPVEKQLPPYSATQVVTIVQTRPNGAVTQNQRTGIVARDAQGRTFFKHDAATDSSAQPGAQTIITISDPTTGLNYTILPDVHRVTTNPRPKTVNISSAAPAEGAPTAAVSNSVIPPRVVHESLGTRTIAGVRAIGERTTTTRPSAPGQPEQVSVNETWRSPELNIVMLSRSIGRMGTGASFDNTLTLQDLRLTEPPKDWFTIPANYTVVHRDPEKSLSLAAELFRQAKAALPNVPSNFAPRYLDEIARYELNASDPAQRKSAEEDFKSAFAEAVALSPGSHDVSPNGYDPYKAPVEQDAVMAVLRLDPMAALDLVRHSDLHGSALDTMYEDVVVVLGTGKNGAAVDFLALVHECQQASGQYPYRSVATLLRRAPLEQATRLSLAREGLTATSLASVDSSSNNAVYIFLSDVHQVLPQMDPEVETTLLEVLQPNAAEASTTADTAAPRAQVQNRQKAQLLGLLEQLDPERASELKPQLPALAAAMPPAMPNRATGIRTVSFANDGSPVASMMFTSGPGGRTTIPNPNLEIESDPAASLQAAGSETDPVVQFLKLAQLARVLSSSLTIMTLIQEPGQPRQNQHFSPNPAMANQAADAALALLSQPDNTILMSALPAGIQLAMALQKLERAEPANALLEQCLGAADAQVVMDQQRQSSQPSRTPPQIGMEGSQLYSRVAALAPEVALAHLDHLDNPLFKPLAQAAVASSLH